MMKNKVFKALLLAFAFCLFLTAVVVPAQASVSDVSGATVDETADNSVITYTNPDTGYELELNDQLYLLSDQQKDALKEIMKVLTKYSHVVFLTTDNSEKDIFISEEDSEDATYPISLLVYSRTDDTIWFGTDCDRGNLADDDLLQEIVNRSNTISWYSAAKYGFTVLINRFRGDPDDTVLNIGADVSDDPQATVGPVLYTNPDTGYSLIILDDIDLLTDEEEEWLIEDMKPVTEYGSIAFWSTDQTARDEIDQARVKRKELFEFESASVFVINMGIRKLTIQSYGNIYNNINDSYARSITDNVSHYATDKKYYNAASEVYQQIYQVMNGADIPEPMKITGYVIMSIIIGLTVALSLAFSAKYNPIRELPVDANSIQGSGTFSKKGSKITISKEERTVSTSSYSGGGGCSSCGGGGCSSCGGGGSSCGGGGCGGGGSSSF